MAWNVNTDLVKGNDMFLFLVKLNEGQDMTSGTVSNAKVVAYATSCSLEINADTLDTTSKLSCRWNSVMQGNASYTVSSDALYCKQSSASANSAYTIDDLFEAMVDGDNIGWVMAQNSASCGEAIAIDTASTYYYGTAAITSLSINAGNNEIANSSISLTGDGKPEKVN